MVVVILSESQSIDNIATRVKLRLKARKEKTHMEKIREKLQNGQPSISVLVRV